MANNEELLKKIIAHTKEYGYIFPSSEIYDGLSAVYDYGQYGVELKNNIRNYWWKNMVYYHDNIVGIDSAIFMHPMVWKASGHADAFNDPMIDNKDSKQRYRVDVLIEDYIAKLEDKILKEISKAAQRFGDKFDKQMFIKTNAKIADYQKNIDLLNKRFIEASNNNDLVELKKIIDDFGITCPVSGTKNWTEVRQFNLMFSTQMGSVNGESNQVYLRPETAQGIFVNFLNVQKSGRMKIPFGIAQTGKAFRNEIVARQFIFRMREFEQMEMQFFVKPGTELEWFSYWKEERLKWHLSLGIPSDMYRFHDHDKLAHYANAACDIEFAFPMGFKELEGIHSRTNFDLSAHEKYTGKKLRYFDNEINESYIPYVIETSIGLDRMFLAILTYSFKEEKLEDGTERVVLKIPPVLAPVKVAVLPLVKKDGMPEKALEILKMIKGDFMVQYDEKDTIGRRYRRQDAIGTPYCITVDTQTFEDDTVTIRERDSMKQDRVKITQILEVINKKLNNKYSYQ
ncbi:MAG TPA: glycine--tRNA ligase [Bacteroidales bacterium]|nr:glycine--tRNA ligase [Bacteroidales bacterium]